MITKSNIWCLFFFKYIIFYTESMLVFCYIFNKNYKVICAHANSFVIDKYNYLPIAQTQSTANIALIGTFLPIWTKVILKGKSYKIKVAKSESKVTFRLGHSHWIKLFFASVYYNFLRYTRQKFLLVSSSRDKLNALVFIILRIRQLNIYTSRGVRLKCQLVQRRFGKMSQYVSTLH